MLFRSVVADPWSVDTSPYASRADVGTLGKNRVEVTRDHHGRPIADTRSLANGIPFRIDANVAQAKRRQSAAILGAATRFAEGRCRDLTERHLLAQRPRIVVLQRLHRDAHSLVVRGWHGRLTSHRHTDDGGKDARTNQGPYYEVAMGERHDQHHWGLLVGRTLMTPDVRGQPAPDAMLLAPCGPPIVLGGESSRPR